MKKIIIIGDCPHGIISAAILRQLEKSGHSFEIATLQDAEQHKAQVQNELKQFKIIAETLDPLTKIDIKTINEPFYKQIGKRKGKKGYRKW
jgi:hypothetical protein